MTAEAERPLSRRQLLTQALPRGIAELAAGMLRARDDLADLVGVSDPRDARRRALNRELDEILERNRREYPEYYANLPDLSDHQAVLRHIDELEERMRREHPDRFGEPVDPDQDTAETSH